MKKIFFLLLSHLVIVGCIRSKCPDKEPYDCNKEDWSELMISIYNGQTEHFTKLISQGSDLNFRTSGTSNLWQLTALDVAILKQNELAAYELLKTNKISNPGSYLMEASSQNSPFIVEQLLKHGANVNDTLENGYSIVMSAASSGSLMVLDCLLKHGANIKQTMKVGGMTPLMYAVLNHDPEKVKLLLSYGADKDIHDQSGKRAFDYVNELYDWEKVSDDIKFRLRKLLK